ncbi:MAG: peptide chain release factor N(5)-glutamine methyltransferase [Clostridia bacterium]|nr:peptide chain release factor N(5)-glutamine methyltransferase [Clostridia bacterium]
MTVQEALEWAKKALESVSGEDASADARELVSFALQRRVRGADGFALLTIEQEKTLDAAIRKRLEREPLQYVIGEWDFMGLTFAVSPDVLIPRQDTETLAEEAERLIAERGYKTLLDICTGSGCIGVSLQRRTGIRATLSDISEKALAVARDNAERLGADCETVKSDLFEAFGGRKFDLITANPPYIPSEIVKTLSDEVKKEPLLALDGGEDGLDLYRRIGQSFAEHLNEGGALLMEIGFDQGESVHALFAAAEGRTVRLLKDLANNNRVVSVTLE